MYVWCFCLACLSFVAIRPSGRYTTNDPSRYLNAEYEGEILFTYDVTWDYTTMPWTQRWALLFFVVLVVVGIDLKESVD